MAGYYGYNSKYSLYIPVVNSTVTDGTGSGGSDLYDDDVYVFISQNYANQERVFSYSVYNYSRYGFTVISYYKNSRAGAVSGGPNTGTFRYVTINKTSIDSFKCLNPRSVYNPIIKCGYFDTALQPDKPVGPAKATVSGLNMYGTDIYVAVTPTTNTEWDVISCSIFDINFDGFTAISQYKDGRDGEDGGKPFVGRFMYMAVDKSSLSSFKYNNQDFITCGTFNTTGATSTSGGVANVTFPIIFNGDQVPFIAVTPNSDNGTNIISCSLTNVTKTGFTAVSFSKDGRAGEDGGGGYNGQFMYIAIFFL